MKRSITHICLFFIAAFMLIWFCSNLNADHIMRLLPDSKTESTSKTIKNLIGTKIKFPDNMPIQIQGTYIKDDFSDTDYKIVTYIDSTGCTECRMKLQEWNDVIAELKSIGDVNFLMLINSHKPNMVNHIIKNNQFSYPICCENAKLFERINNLPLDSDYHTILLDDENKIVAIGNPILNPKIYQLFRQIISNGKDEISNEIKLCRNPVRSLGIVSTNDTIKIPFCLINRDSVDYKIQKLVPSCNCTTAYSTTNSIKRGETCELEVIYISDNNSGFFQQYVDIYFYEKEKPERVIFFGHTI